MSISYTKLSTNFAKVKDKDAGEIADMLHGNVEYNIKTFGWVNMCAIRLSFALNYSGLTIGHITNTVSGYYNNEKKWYLYKVPDMIRFIRNNIGVEPRRKDIIGKRGIIIFTECPWHDAIGHVDLFNGFTVEGKGYPECGKVELYELL